MCRQKKKKEKPSKKGNENFSKETEGKPAETFRQSTAKLKSVREMLTPAIFNVGEKNRAGKRKPK